MRQSEQNDGGLKETQDRGKDRHFIELINLAL